MLCREVILPCEAAATAAPTEQLKAMTSLQRDDCAVPSNDSPPHPPHPSPNTEETDDRVEPARSKGYGLPADGIQLV